MDNFKCLIVFNCDDLNKKDIVVSIDFMMPVKLLIRNYLNL